MFLYAYTALAERMVALKAGGDRGATAVEYGLLAALIAAVIVAIVATVGNKLGTAFSTVTNAIP
jgi:pilus assembly protein Flp/PilA